MWNSTAEPGNDANPHKRGAQADPAEPGVSFRSDTPSPRNEHGKIAYVRSTNAIWAVLDDKAVVLDLDAGGYYTLNEMSAAVWTLCDGAHVLDDIHRAMAKRSEVCGEWARHNLNALISDLEREGLVLRKEIGDGQEEHLRCQAR